MKRPTVVAFDVFETLFSLESLKPRLARAGLRTAFVSRGKPFPAVMQDPDLLGETMGDISRQILEL
jgi:hypothetical protein